MLHADSAVITPVAVKFNGSVWCADHSLGGADFDAGKVSTLATILSFPPPPVKFKKDVIKQHDAGEDEDDAMNILAPL